MMYFSARHSFHQFLSGIFFCVLFLLAAGSTTAQRFSFHNLNVDEGLVQSQATCLAQDKTGNLWIGTLGGLSRYDGKNFTNFTVRNGLQSNAVYAIAVDASGSVWIGGQQGISRYDGSKFTHFGKQQQSTRLNNNNQQIQVLSDTIWWRVQGDLYYITKGKIKYFVAPGPTGYVSAILVEKNGLWLAKDGILYHQMNARWDTILFALPPEQNAPTILRLYRDKDKTMWVGTNAGLYKVEQGQLVGHPVNDVQIMPQPVISSLSTDKTGALWLGTNSGIIKIAGNIVQYYNKHNGLSDNNFFDILTDNEGNVWMASDGQGVFRYSGTPFSGLDESMGLPSAQVMAIASDGGDSLFLGTYDAGLYVFKDEEVNKLEIPSSPAPAITSLCYTSGAKLWIGTRGRGLWSYQNEVFRQYKAPDRNFPSNFIQCLYQDAEKRLWIGFNNGAMVLENDSFRTVISKNESVVSFLTIGKDSVLIATYKKGGLQLYSGGIVSDFITNTAIDSSSVQCFVLKDKELWMGCNDNGVIRYNMVTHKARIINKNDGLRSDFIYNITTDNDSNIWVGTGFGIHKIKMADDDEPQITFYGKAQGITGMESNINAVLKQPDGSIWFGTTNGAIHYQPHTTVISGEPTNIILQSVKLTGETNIDRSWYDSSDTWYGIPYNLRLPFKKNNISFSFQAITLSGAEQVSYRYHLDGLESPWSDWSSTNSVTYSALPPGSYVFHVQCRGADGLNIKELTYPFEIITPFQKTKWFRYAVLGACILLGITLQYIISSRKQRRMKLLAKLRSEEQAKIRLRTAEDFHDEIGNKLTRINVLTNVLKSKIELNPDSTRILGQIEDNTSELYSGTRDILWSLKPSNDNLYEILHRIRDFGTELFQDTEIEFKFMGSDEKWRKFRLPMDMSRNLIMIFKEAFNNALKYSKAKTVTMDVMLKNKNVLQILLKDDGHGFDPQTVVRGNGLNNMNLRATRMNGKLYIDSRKDKGTIINLSFKIPPNR